MKQKLQIFLYGILMGMADVIPGVSGATIAYLLRFYETFLKTIKSFDLTTLKLLFKGQIKASFKRPSWHIAIPLLMGMICGFVIFAKIIPIPQLLQLYPAPVYGLFFGLITASLPSLIKKYPLNIRSFLFLILGISLGLIAVNLPVQNMAPTSWFLFICGFLAISAMMLPGISGSFILLILGQYTLIIGEIANLNFTFLFPFILGAFCSLFTFSRLLHYLVRSFPANMTFTICGILIGSLWRIWPFQERIYIIAREKKRLISSTPILPSDFNGQFWLTIFLICLGAFCIFLLEKLSNRHL